MIMIGIIFVLLLAAYVLINQRVIGPVDKTNIRSHHLKTDSISDLLSRMEWALLRPNRVNYLIRYLMWGLWVTFLGSFVMMGHLPSAGEFLRNWLVITMILLSLHGYYYWHADKFSYFAALNTLETIRARLGAGKSDAEQLDIISDHPTGFDAPWVFTHADYALGTRFPQ